MSIALLSSLVLCITTSTIPINFVIAFVEVMIVQCMWLVLNMVVCVFDFDISVASVSDIQRSICMSTALYYNVGVFV